MWIERRDLIRSLVGAALRAPQASEVDRERILAALLPMREQMMGAIRRAEQLVRVSDRVGADSTRLRQEIEGYGFIVDSIRVMMENGQIVGWEVEAHKGPPPP
jgi:hypothetical protein